MGCGCGRNKTAVTSVNKAQEELEQKRREQDAASNLEQQMASLRAAVHNSNSEVVVASS
jgi:hypothetical protein